MASGVSTIPTLKGDIPVGQWLRDLQIKIDNLLSKIEPNKVRRNKLIDKEAMKIWVKAFTHNSFNFENNYQTLELMGDQVLDLYFLDYFMKIFPNLSVGSYSDHIQYYQNRDFQGNLTDKYGLMDHLAFIKGTQDEIKLKSDIFEAFYGALFTVSNMVLPGLGGVMSYNMIKFMFDQENVKIIAKKENKPKTVFVEMFRKFKTGETEDTTLSKSIIEESNRYTRDDPQGKLYRLILPRNVIEFLTNNGHDLRKLNLKVTSEGGVVLAEFLHHSFKEAEDGAYRIGLERLASIGFDSKRANNIKWQLDFNPLDQELVRRALEKAKRSGLVNIIFATPQDNRLNELRGVTKDNKKIPLATEIRFTTDTIIERRNRLLLEYLSK